MELLGQVLVQYDGCSNEKGKSARGPTHTEDHAKTQGEPRTPKNPHTPEAERRQARFSPGAISETTPKPALTSGLQS